jgi:hypothetical protein
MRTTWERNLDDLEAGACCRATEEAYFGKDGPDEEEETAPRQSKTT